jgi:CRISPR system Cascade subunit CasE
MAYLSRVYLNPLRPFTQRFLQSPQVAHAAILGGLARQPVTERVLWRLELEQEHRATVLILTQSKPSWEHLIERGGWPSTADGEAKIRSYDHFLERVVPGAEFVFCLRANPVQATRHPDKPSPAQVERIRNGVRTRGLRVPERTAAHQLKWLLSRVAKWGFEIPVADTGEAAVRIVARDRIVFFRESARGVSDRVVLQTATFVGRLRISDEVLARRSLLQGVGKARAYGCGLITLAPCASPGFGSTLMRREL